MTGKAPKTVDEIKSLSVISRKTPDARPTRKVSDLLNPWSTPIEALEILLGPGVKMVIRT